MWMVPSDDPAHRVQNIQFCADGREFCDTSNDAPIGGDVRAFAFLG